MRYAVLALLCLLPAAAFADGDSPYQDAPADSPYADAPAESPYAGSTPAADAARLEEIKRQAAEAEAAAKRAAAEAAAAEEELETDVGTGMSDAEALRQALSKAGMLPGTSAATGTVTGPSGTFDWTTTVDPNSGACGLVKVAAPEEQASCRAGTMGACYRAAAAACQAAINAGGCGTPIADLAECVRANTASSDALRSNAPVFDPNASSSTPQAPSPVQPTGNNDGKVCPYAACIIE